MMLDTDDWNSLWVTTRLATTVTLILLALGTPLAWWICHLKSPFKGVFQAVVAMPLVLPPTVLGFYLLISMGPYGPIGWLTEALGIGLLPFTFGGLVIGSLVYSLPFAVQPIQNAFQAMGHRPMEVAATLGAGPIRSFFTVALPQARRGILTAAILSFAHTVGEFGVVLMLGGNVSGETRVASIQIYGHVEAMQYTSAHWLSAGMVLFSFAVLLIVNLRLEKPHE